jgi:hypothetical protein
VDPAPEVAQAQAQVRVLAVPAAEAVVAERAAEAEAVVAERAAEAVEAPVVVAAPAAVGRASELTWKESRQPGSAARALLRLGGQRS